MTLGGTSLGSGSKAQAHYKLPLYYVYIKISRPRTNKLQTQSKTSLISNNGWSRLKPVDKNVSIELGLKAGSSDILIGLGSFGVDTQDLGLGSG